MTHQTRLIWRRFRLMTEACVAFKGTCCIYVIADSSGTPLYVGESESKGGLDGRYHGGTAAAVDAAMHGSGNCIYVAEGERGKCGLIEKALIFAEHCSTGHAFQPLYNRRGRITPLSTFPMETLIHEGEPPAFRHRRPDGA